MLTLASMICLHLMGTPAHVTITLGTVSSVVATCHLGLKGDSSSPCADVFKGLTKATKRYCRPNAGKDAIDEGYHCLCCV